MLAAPLERSEMPRNFDRRTGVMCRLPQEVLLVIANLAGGTRNLWKNLHGELCSTASVCGRQSLTGMQKLTGSATGVNG